MRNFAEELGVALIKSEQPISNYRLAQAFLCLGPEISEHICNETIAELVDVLSQELVELKKKLEKAKAEKNGDEQLVTYYVRTHKRVIKDLKLYLNVKNRTSSK